MTTQRIRMAAAPADAPLRGRVPSPDNIPDTDAAFRSLLAGASIYITHSQMYEAKATLHAALDIALRRWWLNSQGRPDSHFLDSSDIFTRLRASALIPRARYERIKKILRRKSNIQIQHLTELRQVANGVHQLANELGEVPDG